MPHETGAFGVLFAGGGTGGHLMPGAATAEALRELFPQARCLFLTTDRKAERHCHGAIRGFERLRLRCAPSGGLRGGVRLAGGAFAAAAQALELIRWLRPRVVVGLGGYSCVVPVLVARALGRPTALMESNAVPGRAVRRLAPVVDLVQLQWEAAAAHLRARRVLVCGNPVRARIFRGDRQRALRRFVLHPGRLTLLVMGGSQGALSLNRLLAGALKRLARPPRRIRPGSLQVLHLTGPDHLAEARRMQVPWCIHYRPVGFLEEMEDAYAVADLVLARAGGSTLAELTALGLPSVLVPYPYATDGHQAANAALLERAGAAVTVQQEGLSAEDLARVLWELLNDGERLRRMAAAARAMGRADAATAFARQLAAMAGAAPAGVASRGSGTAALGEGVRWRSEAA